MWWTNPKSTRELINRFRQITKDPWSSFLSRLVIFRNEMHELEYPRKTAKHAKRLVASSQLLCHSIPGAFRWFWNFGPFDLWAWFSLLFFCLTLPIDTVVQGSVYILSSFLLRSVCKVSINKGAATSFLLSKPISACSLCCSVEVQDSFGQLLLRQT